MQNDELTCDMHHVHFILNGSCSTTTHNTTLQGYEQFPQVCLKGAQLYVPIDLLMGQY